VDNDAVERIKVVVADDHLVLREGIRNLLEDQPDIELVGEAANGLEAVAVVRATEPDVVLMDVVMPRVTGIEATKQIKKLNPGTAVLILSGYDDDRYVLGLLEAGAAGYLLKSASGDEVVNAIRTVYAGESVMHPSVTRRLLARASRSTGYVAQTEDSEPLTQRELEVLGLAAKGLGNKQIANELGLSVPTVKSHLVNIFNKLGVASRTEAVLFGLRAGWLDLQAEFEEPTD
jgi:NarL family two-component system response regulator LiaR